MRCMVLVSAFWGVLSFTADAQEPTPLFNGRDLTGWEQVGLGKFVVEDGMLRTDGGMGLLWYAPRKIGDAVIRVVYRTLGKTHGSGVFIRIPDQPIDAWWAVNRGYEVQIDDNDDDWHATGGLYSLTKVVARPGKPGEWNVMEITLDGPHTAVTVNGIQVTDFREGDSVPRKEKSYEPDRGRRPDLGYIGLQNHNARDTVYIKEVSVRPLPRGGRR